MNNKNLKDVVSAFNSIILSLMEVANDITYLGTSDCAARVNVS